MDKGKGRMEGERPNPDIFGPKRESVEGELPNVESKGDQREIKAQEDPQQSMIHAAINLGEVINTSLVNYLRCQQERILLYSVEINLQVPPETCLQIIPA